MFAYYNEHEPFPVAWLKKLCEHGYINPGFVDARDIHDIRPCDLEGYEQHHFFAGIGIWSAALRAAGWPDSRPVWTGSCPCQPFSGAGQRRGRADERHLWPVWFNLIRECRPAIVIGEQVASPDALDWIDHVQADMEAEGYAFAAVDMGAAGIGAPHWRQRLWWVANSTGSGHERRRPSETRLDGTAWQQPERLRDVGELANAGRAGLPPRECGELPGPHGDDEGRTVEQCGGASRGLADANSNGRGEAREHLAAAWDDGALGNHVAGAGRPGPVNGFWADADWIRCTDGKWRPVEPGTQPLAHGYPARVGKLRAYGNAICLPAATTFVKAVKDTLL